MYGLIYEYCNVWLSDVFSYHPHFNKVNIFVSMLVTFFSTMEHVGVGGTDGFGLTGSSKIIFLFFPKHKVVSVNYSLILTTFFLFFNGIRPLQREWTTFNGLYMNQSTEQWAWKIVILTFIMRPVSGSIDWYLTIYQSAPSDVRSSSSGSAIAQFNFCLLSVNRPTIYCCAPVKCAMVVCRPVICWSSLFFLLI